MRITQLIRAPDIATLLNATFGFFAMIVGASGEIRAAAVFILAAAGFDYLDGKIARLTGRSGDFGKQLDSLADTVSFVVAPAFLGFAYGLRTTTGVLCLSLFVSCGILRLARFNITKVSGFEGVPTTANGIFLAVVFLAGPKSINPHLLCSAYATLAVLMVSKIRVTKIK